MIKKHRCLTIIALVAAILCVVYHISHPSGSYNVRTTIAVETPEGLKTGSAVRKISFWTDLCIFDHGRCPSIYYTDAGEAAVVDLGKRGLLFALLRPITGDYDSGWAAYLQRSDQVTLTREKYPMFVHFRNLNDPTTVEKIFDTASIHYNDVISADHTEEIFGNGVKIKEVIAERTHSAITTGLEKKLTWLTMIAPVYIKGNAYDRYLSCRNNHPGKELYTQLKTGDFQRPSKVSEGQKVDQSLCKEIADGENKKLQNDLKLAESGDAEAQYSLAVQYQERAQEASDNRAFPSEVKFKLEACFWYQLSIIRESKYSMSPILICNLITPREKIELDKRIQEWKSNSDSVTVPATLSHP